MKYYLIGILKKLTGHTAVELMFKALAAIAYFFIDIKIYWFSILTLLILDVITGISASYKKGIGFKSRIFRKGLLEKLALYCILIVAVAHIDNLVIHVFEVKHHYSLFVVTFLICLYETSSILENITVLKPDLPFLKGLSRIFTNLGPSTLSKVETKIEDIIDKTLDVDKKE